MLLNEDVENERVRSYIKVLDEKSQRLKQLTDDLVEASKISSGNINLHFEKINLLELVNQTIGEFSEKFEKKCLTSVINVNTQNAVIEAELGFFIQYLDITADAFIFHVLPLDQIHIIDDGSKRRFDVMRNIRDQICLHTFVFKTDRAQVRRPDPGSIR